MRYLNLLANDRNQNRGLIGRVCHKGKKAVAYLAIHASQTFGSRRSMENAGIQRMDHIQVGMDFSRSTWHNEFVLADRKHVIQIGRTAKEVSLSGTKTEENLQVEFDNGSLLTVRLEHNSILGFFIVDRKEIKEITEEQAEKFLKNNPIRGVAKADVVDIHTPGGGPPLPWHGLPSQNKNPDRPIGRYNDGADLIVFQRSDGSYLAVEVNPDSIKEIRYS